MRKVDFSEALRKDLDRLWRSVFAGGRCLLNDDFECARGDFRLKFCGFFLDPFGEPLDAFGDFFDVRDVARCQQSQ